MPPQQLVKSSFAAEGRFAQATVLDDFVPVVHAADADYNLPTTISRRIYTPTMADDAAEPAMATPTPDDGPNSPTNAAADDAADPDANDATETQTAVEMRSPTRDAASDARALARKKKKEKKLFGVAAEKEKKRSAQEEAQRAEIQKLIAKQMAQLSEQQTRLGAQDQTMVEQQLQITALEAKLAQQIADNVEAQAKADAEEKTRKKEEAQVAQKEVEVHAAAVEKKKEFKNSSANLFASAALVKTEQVRTVGDEVGVGNEELLQNALMKGVMMGLPCVSVAVATRKGVVWSNGEGYCDVQRQVPVARTERFCVGSITKSLVAVVVLQLVEAGLVDLNGTVLDYIDVGIVAKIANTDSATIRQLLSHQSGIASWEFEKEWVKKARGEQIELGKVWGRKETLQYATTDRLPATCEPGERFNYSNTNYTLLGLLIEAVTGHTLEAEVRRRIIVPLKLSDTYLESYEPKEHPEAAQRSRLYEAPDLAPFGRATARPYHFATPEFEKSAGLHRNFVPLFGRQYVMDVSVANLRYSRIPPAECVNFLSHLCCSSLSYLSYSCEWAAGGYCMSSGDLAIFARALRDGTLLKPAVSPAVPHRSEMFTFTAPREDTIDDDGSGKAPARTRRELGQEYCLGILKTVEMRSKYPDLSDLPTVANVDDLATEVMTTWGHGGRTLGFSANFEWMEGEDCCISYMTNIGSMHSGDVSPFKLWQERVMRPAVRRYLGLDGATEKRELWLADTKAKAKEKAREESERAVVRLRLSEEKAERERIEDERVAQKFLDLNRNVALGTSE